MASRLADIMELPSVFIRKHRKIHGASWSYEGIVPERAKVLIVEDVVSIGTGIHRVAEQMW